MDSVVSPFHHRNPVHRKTPFPLQRMKHPGWNRPRNAMTSETSSPICLRVSYAGRVQGVGFRWTVSRIARRFEVAGSVRNLANGTVELIAQGDRQIVSDFLGSVTAAMHGHIESSETVEIGVQEDLAGFRVLH